MPYELVGVINQHGDFDGGHYTADVKRGDLWFYTDDIGRKVYAIDSEEVSLNSGSEYILAFQRPKQDVPTT